MSKNLINTIFQTTHFNQISNELKNSISSAIPTHINLWSSQGSGLNSFSQWSNAISSISSYNSARIATARLHINQSLNLQGQRTVQLDVDPPNTCLLYTSPSPRDKRQSRMPSSA